jgi:peptidoglycan/xylan/chitin deacetylase (PgdA/CDA1 family)
MVIVSELSQMYSSVLKQRKKLLIVTIDDGPAANVTPGILDVLRT